MVKGAGVSLLGEGVGASLYCEGAEDTSLLTELQTDTAENINFL